jgi:hypothetical protein
MTQNEYEKVMMITEILALRQFTNQELAAMNLAIQRYGRVSFENLSYNKAVSYKLIREDGTAWDKDTLTEALTRVICDIVAKGEWQ